MSRPTAFRPLPAEMQPFSAPRNGPAYRHTDPAPVRAPPARSGICTRASDLRPDAQGRAHARARWPDPRGHPSARAAHAPSEIRTSPGRGRRWRRPRRSVRASGRFPFPVRAGSARYWPADSPASSRRRCARPRPREVCSSGPQRVAGFLMQDGKQVMPCRCCGLKLRALGGIRCLRDGVGQRRKRAHARTGRGKDADSEQGQFEIPAWPDVRQPLA